MALEAWGHRRIEAGEPFHKVLADVLGPPGAPAAYLLVAVDLLLSHWPKSREAAVPFLACPELLCLDRQRIVHDNLEFPDMFGLKALQKGPVGMANLDGLKKYPSRRRMFDDLISQYALGPAELRDTLSELLRQAATRIGPPNDQSDLSDPALMVVYGLNLLDPTNWREVSIEQVDGTRATVHQYESPEAERRHFESLQQNVRKRHMTTNMQNAIGTALDDPSRSAPYRLPRA